MRCFFSAPVPVKDVIFVAEPRRGSFKALIAKDRARLTSCIGDSQCNFWRATRAGAILQNAHLRSQVGRLSGRPLRVEVSIQRHIHVDHLSLLPVDA